MSVESDLSNNFDLIITANTDNKISEQSKSRDASPPNNHLHLKAAPKIIEKLCPQSVHQKPKNLKEKSQLKSTQRNTPNMDDLTNCANGKLINNNRNLSTSRALINSKLAHLKTNSTLKQTILNNSILPSPYGLFFLLPKY